MAELNDAAFHNKAATKRKPLIFFLSCFYFEMVHNNYMKINKGHVGQCD